MHEIRKIVTYPNGTFCMGVSLPIHLSDKWLNIFVKITESGNKIILESGSQPIVFKTKDFKNSIIERERIYL